MTSAAVDNAHTHTEKRKLSEPAYTELALLVHSSIVAWQVGKGSAAALLGERELLVKPEAQGLLPAFVAAAVWAHITSRSLALIWCRRNLLALPNTQPSIQKYVK